jgi:hypothetical protein
MVEERAGYPLPALDDAARLPLDTAWVVWPAIPDRPKLYFPCLCDEACPPCRPPWLREGADAILSERCGAMASTADQSFSVVSPVRAATGSVSLAK